MKLRLPRGGDLASTSGRAIKSPAGVAPRSGRYSRWCSDKEDRAVVVRRSDGEKVVSVLSQARRQVIVDRRHDLEEGDRVVVCKALVVFDGYGCVEVATPRRSSRSMFEGAR